MWLKYIVVLGDIPIALKFNTIKNIVLLGGTSKFEKQMVSLIREFFDVRDFERRTPSRNRTKFVFDYDYNRFFDVIDEMKQNDVLVQDVEVHGRLLR